MHTIAERAAEVRHKLSIVRQMMSEHQVDALELRLTTNLAWITSGVPTYINEASDTSPVTIWITPDRAFMLTDKIEAPRMREEQAVESLGFELVIEPWYQRGAFVTQLTTGKRIGQDVTESGVNLGAQIKALRSVLLHSEQDRLRANAQLAAQAMAEAIYAVRPAMTEHEAAGLLSVAARRRGGSPIVTLVASDARIFQYRHPLPTMKPIEKYAMLVLCFRKDGFVISLTRLVHFGALSDELARKMHACAEVDAKVNLGTQAGRTMGEMFNLLKEAYAAAGFPEAIEEHHQGGSAGYASREVIATLGNTTPIVVNQMFAWNPSIRGVKSEDSTLLTERGIEVLTEIPGFPVINVVVDGQPLARPAILQW